MPRNKNSNFRTLLSYLYIIMNDRNESSINRKQEKLKYYCNFIHINKQRRQ
jgi:hypothetical protein